MSEKAQKDKFSNTSVSKQQQHLEYFIEKLYEDEFQSITIVRAEKQLYPFFQVWIAEISLANAKSSFALSISRSWDIEANKISYSEISFS